jgi:hypothetical protein
MERLGPYEVHPFAAAFPLIEGDQFDELVKDIKDHGLRDPIVLSRDGSVLIDGRNRWRACKAAGVKPDTRCLDDESEQDILDLIASSNVHRRHLSLGELAMIGVEYEKQFAAATKMGRPAKESIEEPRDFPGSKQNLSSERAGRAVGVNGRAVSVAKRLVQEAPDLAEQVRSGEKKLWSADAEMKERKKSGETKPPGPTDIRGRRLPMRAMKKQIAEGMLSLDAMCLVLSKVEDLDESITQEDITSWLPSLNAAIKTLNGFRNLLKKDSK